MQCPTVREGLCCVDCQRPLGVGRLRNQLTLMTRLFTKKYYAVSCYAIIPYYVITWADLCVISTGTSALMLCNWVWALKWVVGFHILIFLKFLISLHSL